MLCAAVFLAALALASAPMAYVRTMEIDWLGVLLILSGFLALIAFPWRRQ